MMPQRLSGNEKLITILKAIENCPQGETSDGIWRLINLQKKHIVKILMRFSPMHLASEYNSPMRRKKFNIVLET